jgi:hypothetical protein
VPKPTMEVVANEWSEFEPLVEMDFDQLCEEQRQLTEIAHSTKERLSQVNSDICAALTVAETKRAKWGNYIVTSKEGCSASRIKAELLVEQGVPVDMIEAATVPGTPYTTPQFTEIKQRD